MVVVREKAEVVVKVRVSVDITVLFGPSFESFKVPQVFRDLEGDRSWNLLAQIARAILKDMLFGAILKPPRPSHLPKILKHQFSDDRAIDRPREDETSFSTMSCDIDLGGTGSISERGNLDQIDGFYSELFLEVIEEGSVFGKLQSSITVKNFGEVSKNVIAGLLVVFISSGSISAPIEVRSSDETVFICTINSLIDGDRDRIIDAAIGDLLWSVGSEDVPVSVMASRQLCLRQAGFDPGDIDGVYGPQTKAAERAFSTKMGGIQVNWSSPVFARFVILQTSRPNVSGMNSELIKVDLTED